MSRALFGSWILFWIVDPRINLRVPFPLAAYLVIPHKWPGSVIHRAVIVICRESGGWRITLAVPMLILNRIYDVVIMAARAAIAVGALNGRVLVVAHKSR